MVGRRSLLLAGAALPAAVSAYGQCVTDKFAVDACRGGVRNTAAATLPPGATLDLDFMTPGTLDPRITFARASVGTYFDSTGTMQTATANIPRWDYDPITHALRGLLIEEARTNLLLNSATLVTQSVTTTAVATTLSFQGTGTVALSGTSTAGPLTGTGANNRVALTFTPTVGSLTLTVTGTVTNAQIEAGAFPTSYIPTAGASATRAVDNALMATSPWFTNPLAFSYMVEAMLPMLGGASTWLQFDDLTTSNRSVLSTDAAALNLRYFENNGGVTTCNFVAAGSLTAGVPFKAGASSIAGQHGFVLNAGAFVSSAAAANPPTVTTLHLGRGVGNATGSFYLRRSVCWPRALSGAELQQATT